jgi:hypothetical protein
MLVLKWWYSSQAPDALPYEHQGMDAAQMGVLFRLKALESNIRKIELLSDDVLVISWIQPEENA